ncbi:MAG: DUF3445 domain-containing protein [Planctomycetaceae bacterium]
MLPAEHVPPWRSLFAAGGFRWGLNLRRGDAAAFFAPSDRSGALLAEKRQLLDLRPDLYLATAPISAPLITELRQLVADWSRVPSAAQTGDLPADLTAMALHWEPDVLLMDRATLSLAAGCVCFPSSWDLRRAIGKTVDRVHDLVPQLNSQIGPQITRFLAELRPGKAFLRENWSLTRTADRNYHPELGRQRLEPDVPLTEVWLRVERQLFTGLPTGGLMGLRIEVCPLLDVANDRSAWIGLRETLRTMPLEVACYKSLADAQAVLVRQMAEVVRS